MSVDSKVSEAMKAAVQEAGQSPGLARRLLAWLEAVTTGNEDLNDLSATDRRLELIYTEVSDGTDPEADDSEDELDDEEDA